MSAEQKRHAGEPGEIPGVTAFAFARLLNPAPDAAALSLTSDGHLMVTVSGEVMSRTDDLLLCSENLEARPLNRRMQGRAVPEVFQRLVSLEGQGHILGRDPNFLVCEGEGAVLVSLPGSHQNT